MRYHLPPPDEQSPRSVAAVARAGATAGPLAHDHEVVAGGDGRLMRTVTLRAGEAAGYLRRWEAERPRALALDAPAGVAVRERSRPDRVVPGAWRRQRLAVREGPDGAVALHWSAPEPVTFADEAAWTRGLGRLTARGATARGGWRA